MATSTPSITAGAALASAIALAALLRIRWLHKTLRDTELELIHARKLRQDERSGRTAAERKLRQINTADGASSTQSDDAVRRPYRTIGKLESCFVERRGTPRQGMLVPAARARLKVDARVIQPKAALDGLEGFSHVWLVYEFHENTNATKHEQVRARVHPPGLGGERIGLFATRTPHRPNPIGLSVARLLSIENGDTLLLGGADLIEGTPVLDIKPYLIHDVQSDAIVPAWCERRTDASNIAEVRFSEEADEQLAAAIAKRTLKFYTDVRTLREAIEQMLSLDIRSVHQGRGQTPTDADSGQAYICRFDALQIGFTTFATHALVTGVGKYDARSSSS